jgi:hypothetical protein
VTAQATYYVTVQGEDGVAVGGRLRLDLGRVLENEAIRAEAGHLVLELIKELGS